MYQILDGKKVSQRVKDELKEQVVSLKQKGIDPGLAVIIVGNDSASRVYVNNKKKACEYIGIRSEEYALPEETTQDELLKLVAELNERKDIHGILCQLPLPKHINEETILYAIDPKKDVDAFHPVNVGKIMIGDFDFLPCTPAGVMDLIEESGIDLTGKECVVVGRSNIVGKPQAMLLLHKNATVTICHSRTKDLADVVSKADIVVLDFNKPHLVPCYDVITNIVFSAQSSDVVLTMVDGDVLYRDGKYKTIDIGKVFDKISYYLPKILEQI